MIYNTLTMNNNKTKKPAVSKTSDSDCLFRVCSKCSENKSIDNYNVYTYKPRADGTQKVGRRGFCKDCQYNNTKRFFAKNENYKKEWRLKNPDKVISENLRAKPRTTKWRLENKEKRKIYRREYVKKNITHINEMKKKESQKVRDLLTDRYVISTITRRSSLKAEDIKENKELIEVQRLILKTKRLWKTSQN
jgi:hypothetical protein